MRRLTPSLALLGVVLLGCAGSNEPGKPGKPAGPEKSPTAGSSSPHQATVEVQGMR